MNESTQTATPSKRNAPEFLLFMVVTFMLWNVGLIDLSTNTVDNPAVAFVGSYGKIMTAILASYSSLFILWLGVLLLPHSHQRIAQILSWIQSRWWLALPLIFAFTGVCWWILTGPIWRNYPGLRMAIVCWLVLVSAILVLSNWRQYARSQNWRKIILIPAICLIIFEGALQVLLYTKQLPTSAYLNSGIFSPYARVYQNREGTSYGITNNYGWYYPDFKLNTERRVILLGDTFIQALQISPEEHLGVHLQSLINASEGSSDFGNEEEPTEVIALGMPGFGPGLYLSSSRLVGLIEQFDPDEVILFFHLSDDVQVINQPEKYDLFFTLNADGTPQIDADQEDEIHDLKHYILPGYSYTVDPLETLSAHILTPKLSQLRTSSIKVPSSVKGMDMPSTRGTVLGYGTKDKIEYYTNIQRTGLASTAGASNFLFETPPSEAAKQAMMIAQGHIRLANDYLASQDVTLRVVTIPAFPRAFFEQATTESWTSALDSYDLLQPEQMLSEFADAQGISFLGMGQQLQKEMSVDEIEALYFEQGQGHFTSLGHKYFAQVVYDIFYSK